MNYDITFCSRTDCKNYKCKRNQKNIENVDVNVSIANFKECKEYE